jgi:phage tail sheath protein FI
MPPTLTYPGVYIAEAASSVHAITGVATSIGAFFGQAAMGPLNTPIECLSYSDYTRNFGGTVVGALLAQSVQQFFSNGGSDCFVVRLADGAEPAQIMLLDLSGKKVLNISASSQGAWGAGLAVTVDYNTPAPDTTFNLQVQYTNNGSVVQSESFANLSMDPNSARYAPTYITQSSQLLTAQAGTVTATSIAAGYSEGRGLPAIAAGTWNAAIQAIWPTGDQGSFAISVDGGPWTSVLFSKTKLAAASASDATTLAYLETNINQALGVASGTQVTVTSPTAGFLRITSSGTAKSSVQVRTAPSGDLAQPLMFGVNQGGIEVARYADLRPVPNGIFFGASGTGEIEAAMDALALAHLTDVTQVTINGVSQPINLTAGGPAFFQGATATDHDGVRENLQAIANVVNNNYPSFEATVAGYRLLIENLQPGSAQAIDTFALTTAGGAAAFGAGFIANVATYTLGLTTGGTYYQPSGPPPTDGNPPTQANYLGSELLRTGFYALDSVDLFNIMVLPGDGIGNETEWQAVRAAAATYCQTRRAFLVLDAPVGWTKNNLLNAQVSDVQTFRAAIGSLADINCAVYYPRVQINDNGTLRYVGPSGMIAGMYAATDASRGVWKAPAGTNAGLTGVTGLEVVLTDKQNGILNPQGVNCVRRMPAGYLIWGARTVAGFDNSGNTDFTYVPVRRMTLFLEESLYRGTQWAVFEPNDEPLWSQIRMNLNAFMMGLFTQGAFQGSTPAQAFFVKCDSETTTQADIDQGIVNIIVGFAPLEPAEFVIVTIQQIVGNLG